WQLALPEREEKRDGGLSLVNPPSRPAARTASRSRPEAPGASRSRPGRSHFRAGAAFVLLEVLNEQPGELLRRGVVGCLVGPGATRRQDFGGHTGTGGGHLEAEHGVALRLDAGQRAAVNRIDEPTSVGQLDPLADAVPSAAPARVDQPDAGVVLL